MRLEGRRFRAARIVPSPFPIVLAATAALAITPLSDAIGQESPATVPERTGYERTSTTAEVEAFLDSLQASGAPVTPASMRSEVNIGS